MALIAEIAGLATSITKVGEVVLDYATIASVVVLLEQAKTSLIEAQDAMESIPPSVVGGSPLGPQLVHHSKLANTSLLDSIKEINKGLEIYGAAMTDSLKDVEGTDDLIGSDLLKGHNRIDDATGASGQG